MKLKNFLFGFGVFAIILTIMPFVAVDYWWVRMFDYPHLQLTFLTMIAILVYFIKFDFKNYRDYIFIGILLLCAVVQFVKIYPYTAFSKYNILNSTKGETRGLKLFAANVLQKNTAYQKVIDEYKSWDPDIMLFTETDYKWRDIIVKSLSSEYKYRVEHPIPNTYGMILYSKLELINPQLKFLVSDSIPSIESKVRLKSGDIFQLYAIHPTPPMPQENPKSTDRDAEMMMTAIAAKESKLPVIVLGDFNDVAWSETSKLFDRVSELLDIRVGRGMYNTFNANNLLLRWPLDHIFISEEFRAKKVERGNNVESDHFPFYAELTFEPEISKEQLPDLASEDDIKKAEKQIKKEKNKTN